MHKGSGGRAARFAFATGILMSAGVFAARPPVVPGYDRLKDEANASPAELGQVLLGELNCAQCHAAPNSKRLLTRGAPDLSNAGARITPQYLRHYIADPHGVKPGTAMPDLFHSSDPQAKQGAVEYLTQYLVSLGGPIKPATEEGNVLLVDEGRKLYQRIGCVACHDPDKGAQMKLPSFPLPANLAEKTTVNQLEAFLLDPLKERPSSRMPNFGLGREEANAIAVYLLRDQMNNPQVAGAPPARGRGLRYEYFDQKPDDAAVETIGRLKAKYTGTSPGFILNIPNRRNEQFGLKFSGGISIPHTGKYTFFITSDDGSRLYLDGHLLLDDDGDHAPQEKVGEIELQEGDHPIVVTYYQNAGPMELKVEWSGPGFERKIIPASVLFHTAGQALVPLNSEKFTVDAQKAQMGGQMFAAMGCASCHNITGQKSLRESKAMAELNLDNDGGCLGTHPTKEVPQYDLSDGQRQALKAALTDKAGLNKPLEPAEQIIHTMAAMNCFACHRRGNVGGPTAERNPFFVMTAEFDMGEEGRIPPHLAGVGAKLRPEAMDAIIYEGKLHIRPVLATRMPMWGKQAMGTLVDAFQKADTAPEMAAPQFSGKSAIEGRQLIGVRGLGCVNCHGVVGVKSLGMPAPDLTDQHERLKYGWFYRLLDNPPAVNPGTRMPQFWPAHQATLKDIAGGTEDGQIAALWTYLSLGKSMALPAGLIPTGGYELIPADAPIVHRTFMEGVGPRAVLVGYPEMVHVAFDANGVKLVESWRGKFFDARGMWEGRGGNWLGPLGTDIIQMPPGPSFAILEHADAPWPVIEESRRDEKYRNIGGHFKGYVLDKQERPTFQYVLNGIDIHEQPLPVLKSAKSDLDRKFTLESKEPVQNLYFLAAAGKAITAKSPGVWDVDGGKLTVTLKSADKLAPVVRDSNGEKQLLVPVQFKDGAASFDVEMSW